MYRAYSGHRRMAAMGQRDPHMEMAPLHEEINTLTSKKLWTSSTESVCHQRASNILDFQKRLQVVMESVNIHIGKHRPAVNAEDGGHRKQIYTLPAPLPDGTRQSIRVSGRILHWVLGCNGGGNPQNGSKVREPALLTHAHTPCITGEV